MLTEHPTIALDPIPDFPGYLICRLGVVFSTRTTSGGQREYPIPLKPGINTRGYHYVSLFRDGKTHQIAVHQLMLETYVGPRPPEMETRHLNNIPGDNRISNLAWGTRAENGNDKRLAGSCRGTRNGNTRLTEDDVRAIRVMPAKEAASRYGITLGNVYHIKKGRIWSHVK